MCKKRLNDFLNNRKIEKYKQAEQIHRIGVYVWLWKKKEMVKTMVMNIRRIKERKMKELGWLRKLKPQSNWKNEEKKTRGNTEERPEECVDAGNYIKS